MMNVNRIATSVLASAMAVTTMASISTPTHAVEKWGNNEEIMYSKYKLLNSMWNAGGISNFWQKIRYNSGTDFGFEWSYPSGTGRDDEVKGYPSVQTGRLWDNNWSGAAPNTNSKGNSGFPIQLSWEKNVWTDFGYNLSNYNGKFNVAYNIWFDDNNSVSPGQPTDEIMIWVANYYVNIWGYYQETKPIDGVNWDVYRIWHPSGWWYTAFIKTGSWITDRNNLNIKSFTDYMRKKYDKNGNVWLRSDRWMTACNFGVETRVGSGRMNMYKWRCDIQW